MFNCKVFVHLSLLALPSVLSSCTDSTTYTFGEYKQYGSFVTRDCDWIDTNPKHTATRRAKWCGKTVEGSLVKVMCPEACDYDCTEAPSAVPTHPTNVPSAEPTGTTCSDKKTFTFGTYPYLGGEVTRTCNWIDANPKHVDSRREEWCDVIYEGTLVKDMCPEACDLCSAMPSVAPTKSPAPSLAPSATPTAPCADTDLRLKIIKDNGYYMSRSCEWVANKDTTNRCLLTGVSAACPRTCGTCTDCKDPPPALRFKFDDGSGSRTIARNCEFVGRKATPYRCNLTNDICRATCGICD